MPPSSLLNPTTPAGKKKNLSALRGAARMALTLFTLLFTSLGKQLVSEPKRLKNQGKLLLVFPSVFLEPTGINWAGQYKVGPERVFLM